MSLVVHAMKINLHVTALQRVNALHGLDAEMLPKLEMVSFIVLQVMAHWVTKEYLLVVLEE